MRFVRRLASCVAAALWLAAPLASVAQQTTDATSAPPMAATTVAATTRIVQPGDTLMTLSREWFDTLLAASESVTLAQVLIGIHRENPQAFGRDMNELLVGATIRLPDAATLRRTPRRVALEEVRATLGIWTAAASSESPATEAPATPPPSTSTPDPAPVESLEARVARIESELTAKQRQLDALAARQAREPPPASRDAFRAWASASGLLFWLALGGLTGVIALIAVLGVRRRRTRASEPAPQPAPSFVPSTRPSPASALAAEALEGDPPPLTDAGNLIDLAQAYLEMGQIAAARKELQQAWEIGDDTQRAEARRLLDSLPTS